MDGTLAVIFLLASLGDMAVTDCPSGGCLARRPADPRLAVQAGAVEFQRDVIAEELALSYRIDRRYGPYRPAVAASVTTDGSAWVGLGAAFERRLTGDLWFEASLMPGFYAAAGGPDLGGPLQFRSSFALGWEFAQGHRAGLYYDHRSNAGLAEDNPGLETWGLRYSFVLG